MNFGIEGISCRTCFTLSGHEYACQKFGWEETNTHLPSAIEKLVIVRDSQPYGSRKFQILLCPECNTYYLYQTDYEYMVNGSEDEEFLTRLTEDEANDYLNEK